MLILCEYACMYVNFQHIELLTELRINCKIEILYFCLRGTFLTMRLIEEPKETFYDSGLALAECGKEEILMDMKGFLLCFE